MATNGSTVDWGDVHLAAERNNRNQLLPALGLVVVAGIPLLFGERFGDYALEMGFQVLLYATLAEAWNLLAGYGGMVSLGTASFVGVGAYVMVGLLNVAKLPPAISIFGSAIAAVALAALVSNAVFRLRGLYFTVGTLALGEALRLLMVNLPYFGGATGLFVAADAPSTYGLYAYGFAIFVIATCVVSLYTASRFAISLRAVRDDETAAAQVGVRAFRVKLIAFMVASMLMGAVGGLQALKLGAIEPYGIFGLAWSINTLSMVIIGGMGMRFGPIIGVVFVIASGEWLADYPDLHMALTGVIVIAVIRWAPSGIGGLVANWVGRLRGRRPAVKS